MATLTFNGESFIVDHATKGTDYIHGYDADGVVIVSFDGITDFSGYSYDGTYMNPSDCLAEQCNNMVYCGGMMKTKGGVAVPASAIGAVSTGNGVGVITGMGSTNSKDSGFAITTPGKMIAVFINMRGNDSYEWTHDLCYTPARGNGAFYCYDMVWDTLEEWPMQIIKDSDYQIRIYRYSGTSRINCYYTAIYAV